MAELADVLAAAWSAFFAASAVFLAASFYASIAFVVSASGTGAGVAGF